MIMKLEDLQGSLCTFLQASTNTKVSKHTVLRFIGFGGAHMMFAGFLSQRIHAKQGVVIVAPDPQPWVVLYSVRVG